jgi:hypothetical protein
MRAKTISVALGLIVVASGAAGAYAAWTLRYSPTALQRAAVRNYLNDPDSAIFRDDRPALTGKHVWCGAVNARNRMGGMIGFTRYVVYLEGKGATDYPAIFFDETRDDDKPSIFAAKWAHLLRITESTTAPGEASMKANLIVLFGSALLAGCGGGGSDAGTSPFNTYVPPNGSPSSSPSPAPAPSAGRTTEGLWTGSTSTGFVFNVIGLETGEVWGVYGRNGLVYGAVNGVTTNNGAAFTGTGRDYYIAGHQVFSISVSGTATARGTIQGTLVGPNPGTFTATYDARYDQAASLADVAGTWMLTGASPAGITSNAVTVSATGAIIASNQFCSATGSVTPRASAKNIFDLTMAFTGASCEFNGISVAGIAVVDKSTNTPRLAAMALTSDKSAGFLASGTH